MRSPVDLHSLRYACRALQLSTLPTLSCFYEYDLSTLGSYARVRVDDAAAQTARRIPCPVRAEALIFGRPMRERSSTASLAWPRLALLAALTNLSRAQQDFSATTPALQAPTGAVSSIRVKTAGDFALDAPTDDALFDDAWNGLDRPGTAATPPPRLCVASEAAAGVASEAAAGGDGGAIRQVSARAHRTERSDRSRAPYHGGWGQHHHHYHHHGHHHHRRRRRRPAIVPPSTSTPLLRLAC